MRQERYYYGRKDKKKYKKDSDRNCSDNSINNIRHRISNKMDIADKRPCN